jgi:nucleoid-associated protein YgaU
MTVKLECVRPITRVMHSLPQPVLRTLTAICIALLLGAANGSAQNLGELARQQRERVKTESTKPAHVFTNEDLARPKILDSIEEPVSGSPLAQVPTAPYRAAAPAAASPATAATEMVPLPEVSSDDLAPVWPTNMPLGDVARYYRQLKELRTPPSSPVVASTSAAKKTSATKGTATPVSAETPTNPQRPVPAATRMSPLQPIEKSRAISVPEITSNEIGAVQEAVASRSVRVIAGDSLWKIASRYLGDGNQWRVIAAANPQIANPHQILAGQIVYLPAAMKPAAAASQIAGDQAVGNQIKVQPGDSLWKLAKAQWGNGLAWNCIAQSNPQIASSDKIFPGQVLMLPANCSQAI